MRELQRKCVLHTVFTCPDHYANPCTVGHTKVRCTAPPAEVADDGWDDNAGVSGGTDGGWESGAAVASDANGGWKNAVVTDTAANGDSPSWDAAPVVQSDDEDDDVPTSAPAEVSW